MQNPFAGLVGLQLLDQDATVWVNDIPGISVEMVTHLRLDTDSSVVEMWGRVQRNALKKLESEIRLELSKKGDYQPQLASLGQSAPIDYETTVPLDAAHAWTGLVFRVPYQPGTSLELQNVSVLVKTAANVSTGTVHRLRLIDASSNVLLNELNWTLQPGLNTLNLNVVLSTLFLQPRDVMILLENIADSLLVLPPPVWNTVRTGLWLKSVSAAGYSGVVPLTANAPAALTLSARWSRSILDSLAPYMTDLSYAYALICGSLLLTEKMGNPKLSLWTLSNRAFADRMEERYMTEARGLIRVIGRRMADDWAQTTTDNPAALEERTDTPQIEEGSYV